MIPEVRAKIEHIQLRSISEGYKKSKVGVIPDAWCCYQIHECLSICNYERKPISEDVRKTIPGPYPYYGPTQAQGYIATYESEGPAVLIGEDGDHFLKYKNQEMTMYVDGKYTVNNHAHVLRGTELCETKWFYYAYQHKSLFDAITRQGAGRYKLTKEALIKLSLQCPPIEEQKKIISILNTQDKVIKLKEKRLAEKQRQKKYLMQQLLTGKKRLPGFIGKWKTFGFNEIFITISTKGHQINKAEYETKGRYPVIDQGRQMIAGYSNKAEKALMCPKEGVIVFGDHTREIKFVNFDFIVGADGTQLLSAKSKNAAIKYLFYYLSNKDIHSDGYSRHFKYVKEFTYRLPPLGEQTAIAEVLSSSDREIELLRQDIEQEKQKKKALMQLLLTGIVRVKT